MTPVPAYKGAIALAHSKYASPHVRRIQSAHLPASVSSTNSPVNTTIATKEQIAATQAESAVDMATHNPDAELAVAQGNALKDEVQKHTTKLSRTVSTAMTNTRKLLELIREAVKKDNPSALEDVDHLWVELEQLFEAAKGAKDALPGFLEKQRNNMALYHTSVMNETYLESQEELMMQHKKVNLQHGLILEHQQAFQEYKSKVASKLKEHEELQEKASRLTLEKGNFRGEVDRYAKLLEEKTAERAEDLIKADSMQKELDNLAASNKQLLQDIEGFQKTVRDLQEKMQATEHNITNRFAAEIKEKTDLLVQETAKTANLNNLISSLKEHEAKVRMEVDKVKGECKLAQEKFNRMATEHSQAFSKVKEQTKLIENLTVDADRAQKECADLKQRLAKLPELEKNTTILIKEKTDLLEQVGRLKIELDEVKDSSTKVNKELAGLTDRLQAAHKENDDLVVRNKDLMSKQTNFDVLCKSATKASDTVTILQNENGRLLKVIEKLKAEHGASVPGGDVASNMNKAALEKNIQVLEEEKSELQAALTEWTALAKRSYSEYKEMLPTFKQAEQYRQDAITKDDQIKALKLELSVAKSSQSNGLGLGGDAKYWKGKYDDLLSKVGG
ncbi:hypothetical protein FB567DRAFT_233977 [Paraphoma chrysanthemicola]|uniref:Uncharacterized protein n=1 Tax=Paraphoma chrysanthemicola TaxID=798071 RepID=A0A8K0RBG6_9PLEO|nr:hypothetical protein FB567DRAFT_233977 [Paraphoma chrysanthemicola]